MEFNKVIFTLNFLNKWQLHFLFPDLALEDK